jgi:TRAP-type C4-dicarboxylate transport system permease small subunit
MMNPLTRQTERIDALVTRLESGFIIVGSITLLGMVGLIFADIVSRKLLKTSLHISMEYSEYGLAFITMLSLSSVTRMKEHLQVKVLIERLGKPARRVAHFFVSLLLLLLYNLFITYMCYRLFTESLTLGSKSQTISHTPLWIPQIVLFIGIVVTDIRLLIELIKRIVDWQGDHDIPMNRDRG